MQERLSGHGSLGLSSSSPAYTTHSGGHSGRGGPTSGHSGHSGTHGSAATMHHQSLQSDFQPPYFPPPFHHSAQSPPQQQVSAPGGLDVSCQNSSYRFRITYRIMDRLSIWEPIPMDSRSPHCITLLYTITTNWQALDLRKISWVFIEPIGMPSCRAML